LAKNLLGFGLALLLARLLEPRDYGLLGMVLFFVGILSALQDTGLANAIIYLPHDDRDVPTHYTALLAISLLLTLSFFGSAPLVARFYETPDLAPLVRTLSLVLLLNGLRGVSQARITKELRLAELAVIETSSGLAAALVAVWLAWRGFGVWSLVANLILQNLLQTAVVLGRLRPRFTLRPRARVLADIFRWGGPLTGSNLLWRFYDNADYLMVAKLLGAGPLGIYTMAFRLATVVNEKIVPVIMRVSFPAFAALKEDPARLAGHWLSVCRYMWLLTLPVLALLAVCAEDFLAIALGSRWSEAAAPLRLLCSVAALRALASSASSLLSATGATGLLFRISLLNTIALPASFAIGCQLGGVLGVGVVWNVVYPPVALYLVRKAAAAAHLPLRSFVENLEMPTFATAILLSAALPVWWWMEPGSLRLIATISAGSGAYVAYLASRPKLRREIGAFLRLQQAD
jgi:O-antigen/teichoic acid export membrane protein